MTIKKSDISKFRKRCKHWLTTLGIFLLIISAIQIVFYYFAFPLLKERICNKVHDKSNELYTMNFDGIRINFLGKSIELDNFSLVADSTVYEKLRDSIDYNKAIYNISVKKLEIKNISAWALLRDELRINKIILESPIVRLTGKPKNDNKKKYDAIHNDLYPLISQWFNSLKIYNIEIENGYFDFHLRLKDEKQKFEIAKININLRNFYLDEKQYIAKNQLFYSQYIELSSENYNIQMADSIHSIKAKLLTINTKDSVILASDVKMLADGPKSRRSDGFNNKFNVKLNQIKISGLDISKAYFAKVVDLKSVEISEPEIQFLKGGKVNKSTMKFEANKDWFPLIKGTLRRISVDSLKIDSASLKIAKISQPTKPTYKADKISIILQGFNLDSLSYKSVDKILYSKNIGIKLSDFQMLLPDNKHKFSAENVLLSTNLKIVKAEKIKIKPTFQTNDSTEKLINVSIPKVEINDINIIKAYNQKDYQIGQVRIILPNIQTQSFIDSAQNSEQKPKTKLFDAVRDEFVNSLTIRSMNIYKGNVNITSKASIKQDSLTLSGKLSMNLGNLKINNSTLNGNFLPFTTTNVDINLNDVTMKMPKNFHTLRCDNFNISSKNDRVYLHNLKYSCETDTNFVSTMKRLKKSSMMDINIKEAEFEKAELLELIFNQELKINKLVVSNPQLSINLYPELKRLAMQNKIEDTTELDDNINDSLYECYTDFDKIFVDALPKNIKLIKIDTLVTDSSILSFNFRDTLNNRLSGTSSDFRFYANGFYFNRDSISPECNFMLAKDYKLDINNFEFMLPDRIHKVKTGNINISVSDSCILSKSIVVSTDDYFGLSKSKALNAYIPDLKITSVDFRKFGQTGILPAGNLAMENSVIITAKNPDQKDSIIAKPKNKKTPLIKGFEIANIDTKNTHFTACKGDEFNMFKDKIVNFYVDLNCKNLSVDTTNISVKGHIVDFSDKNFKIRDFSINLKDSNALKIGDITECNDSLKITDIFVGNPNNQSKTHLHLPKLTLTKVDYMEMAFNKRFVANTIKINDPEFDWFKQKKAKDSTKRKEFAKPEIAVIVDTLKVDGAKLEINRPEKRQLSFPNMDMIATGINTEKEHNGTFPVDHISAGINDYTILLKDSVNRFNFGRVEIDPDKEIVTVKNLDFRPVYNRYEFYKNFDYQKCATYIFCENAVATKFDWKTIIKDKVINCDSLTINNVSFLSYLNRSRAVDTRIQPSLLGWMKKIPARVNVNTSIVNNAYLEIEQLNPLASVPGVLTLNNMSGHIYNMSNDSVHIAKKDTLKFDGKAEVMNHGNVQACFTYMMKSPKNEYFATMKADSIDLKALNPFLENALFAKVNEGILHKADISFKADDKSSKGESKFVYSDLKIAVNKADSVQEKKRGLLTFIANIFVKKKNFRKMGYIYYEPDPTKSFCSYWISSVLSGAKSTLGFNSKEQKDERKLAEKFKDMLSRGKQRKELDKINHLE